MFKKLLITSLACSTFLSGAVSAGLVLDTAGTDYVSLSSVTVSEFNPTMYSGESALVESQYFGWEGANILFDDNNSGEFNLLWTYLGSESGFDNAAFSKREGNFNKISFGTNPKNGPNLIFTEKDGSVIKGTKGENGLAANEYGASYQHKAEGQALQFAFSVECDVNNKNCDSENVLRNGQNEIKDPTRKDQANWFVGFEKISNTDELDTSTAFLFLNDGGGQDGDFDDMVISISLLGNTIRTTAIDEPAMLSMFGFALLGAGFASRRNRKYK